MSTAIKTATYNEQTKELTVEFASSHKSYVYSDVSPQVASNLSNADSKGQYFNTEIRNGYAYKLV